MAQARMTELTAFRFLLVVTVANSASPPAPSMFSLCGPRMPHSSHHTHTHSNTLKHTHTHTAPTTHTLKHTHTQLPPHAQSNTLPLSHCLSHCLSLSSLFSSP